MSEDYSFFHCKDIGIAGTTPVVIKELSDKERTQGLKAGDTRRKKYEARMGVAIMGATNLNEKQMRLAEFNPFHDKWYDNYASGFGNTHEEAIADLKKDKAKLAESLFH